LQIAAAYLRPPLKDECDRCSATAIERDKEYSMFDTKRGVERQAAGSKEPDEFRSAKQVAEWLQISRKTLERMIGDGRFPQPEFKVEGRRTRRWHASQLEAWRARQRGDEALVSIAGSRASTS